MTLNRNLIGKLLGHLLVCINGRMVGSSSIQILFVRGGGARACASAHFFMP